MTQQCRSLQDIKSERRIRNNRIRRRREMRNHFILFAMTLCLIAICSIAVGSFYAQGCTMYITASKHNTPRAVNMRKNFSPSVSGAKDKEKSLSCKYYKSITVSDRDTLWSIAKTYMDEEHYDSIPEYIREVMQINTLTSDTIYADTHLIIPYYGTGRLQ